MNDYQIKWERAKKRLSSENSCRSIGIQEKLRRLIFKWSSGFCLSHSAAQKADKEKTEWGKFNA